MADRDKKVIGRSDEEVRSISERTKIEYGVARRRPVNIIKCLESGFVPTIYGRKKLIFRVAEDDELEGEFGRTEFGKGAVTITVPRRIYQRAKVGDGHARMTLAHELAHAVMHYGTPLFRLISAVGIAGEAKEAAYESAEHQAKVFAAAFLIHDEDAAKLLNADEISVEFCVSRRAAEICFERLRKKAAHEKSAERVQEIAAETKRAILGRCEPKKTTYLLELCTSCHAATLIPIGPEKVLCDTCGFAGDRFQDGDGG